MKEGIALSDKRLPEENHAIKLSNVLYGMKEILKKEKPAYPPAPVEKPPFGYSSKPKYLEEKPKNVRQKKVLLVGFEAGGDLEKAILEQLPDAVISHAKSTDDARVQLKANKYSFLIAHEGEKYRDPELENIERVKTDVVDGKRIVLMTEYGWGGRPFTILYQPVDKRMEKYLSANVAHKTSDVQYLIKDFCEKNLM